MGEGTQRKLAAILAADVVGYSRLMGTDEAGTLAALKAHRASIIDPKATQFGGRIIKLMGDGVLMEFASVVDAVGFAIDMQRGVRELNDGASSSQEILYRIGINIGDVIVEGDDIYGDGVNVAARLEGLAEPGGICISRNVRDQIRDKLNLTLEDLGEVEVKNIARPVRTFRIAMDDKADELSALAPQARPQRERSSLPRNLAIAALGAVAIGAAVMWWQPWAPTIEPARTEAMALPLPDKPSIAVLPFKNLSQAADQEQFTDGMTEDLITDLSKVSGLFVIARNSTFVYKQAPATIKQVAETLGVRYVLEGSVRRAGDQLRVNAQLIDATTGGHLWAERFDGKATDIFAVQDEFVLKIVDALTVQLTATEKTEIEKVDTNKIEAREAFQRGWELYSQFNAHDNEKSIEHFERAVELDPEYGRAYGALALVYARTIFFRWYQTLGIRSGPIHSVKLPQNFIKAKEHPTSLVHVVAAMKHMFYWDTDVAQGPNAGTDDARIEAARAIALQPNDPEAHLVMAWALIAAGKPSEGLNFVEAAMRLNPNYPSHYVFFNAAAHYGLGKLTEAAGILDKGLERNPQAAELAALAASIYAQIGNRQRAREVIGQWRPGAGQEELQSSAAGYRVPVSWVDLRIRTRLRDGLQLAALPLDVTVSSLLDGLNRDGPFEKVRAARALGWFGAEAAPAVGKLIELLDGDDRIVRKEAIITLGKIGTAAKDAVPALKAIADQPLIGFHVRQALANITGE